MKDERQTCNWKYTANFMNPSKIDTHSECDRFWFNIDLSETRTEQDCPVCKKIIVWDCQP